jgi:hypothetical protein
MNDLSAFHSAILGTKPHWRVSGMSGAAELNQTNLWRTKKPHGDPRCADTRACIPLQLLVLPSTTRIFAGTVTIRDKGTQKW